MARTGISYEVVAQAAEQLKAEGKNATIENIRFITGTGSSTTIAMHLRTWKGYCDKAKSLSEDILPEGIMLTMKGLWTHVIKEAQDQIAPVRQNLEQNVAELKIQLQALQEENAHWQQQHQQLMLEKDTVDNEIIILRQLNHQLENEKIAMTATQDGMLKQLQEKQDRIDEVQQLNQQAQANLEHFRESTREQRMIDEQRNQQMQLHLEQTIKNLKNELDLVSREKTDLRKSYGNLVSLHETLEKQHKDLLEKNSSIETKLLNAEKNIIQYEQMNQHLQSQYQQMQKYTEEQNVIAIDLRMQIAVLNEKLSIGQNEINNLSEQNKYIAHEKWIAEQEKSQLMGQLKQLEKIRDVKHA